MPITLIFSILIFFQSCTAYKSMPISLEKVSSIEVKFKVVTKSNVWLKFKRIDQENGSYYGVKKEKGVIFKIPLNEEMIKEVKLKDKTMSVILTSLLVLTIAFLVPAVAFAACGGA